MIAGSKAGIESIEEGLQESPMSATAQVIITTTVVCYLDCLHESK
jgi:hypothetical protein